MYEEGWEREYVVTELVPPASVPDEAPAEDEGWPNFAAGGPWTLPDSDFRAPTLRIDIESIKVHVVRRFEFDTIKHDVRRYRIKKCEPDF